MWCHGPAVATGDDPGLDGIDRVDPRIEVGAGARKSGEVGVERFVLTVGGMIISTGGVRLPSLDQNVADWRPRSVEHVPLDSDPLTRGFRTSDRTSEVLCEDVKACLMWDQADMDIGPSRLRGCFLDVGQSSGHSSVPLQAVFEHG